jgi:hypothetical protein
MALNGVDVHQRAQRLRSFVVEAGEELVLDPRVFGTVGVEDGVEVADAVELGRVGETDRLRRDVEDLDQSVIAGPLRLEEARDDVVVPGRYRRYALPRRTATCCACSAAG